MLKVESRCQSQETVRTTNAGADRRAFSHAPNIWRLFASRATALVAERRGRWMTSTSTASVQAGANRSVAPARAADIRSGANRCRQRERHCCAQRTMPTLDDTVASPRIRSSAQRKEWSPPRWCLAWLSLNRVVTAAPKRQRPITGITCVPWMSSGSAAFTIFSFMALTFVSSDKMQVRLRNRKVLSGPAVPANH